MIAKDLGILQQSSFKNGCPMHIYATQKYWEWPVDDNYRCEHITRNSCNIIL